MLFSQQKALGMNDLTSNRGHMKTVCETLIF
jgi:hypothetical protein